MQPIDIILFMGIGAAAIAFVALALFGALVHLMLK